jgi:type II secretory pathway predicted ATPase ExeA
VSGSGHRHLHPEVRALADLPDDRRIAAVLAERWIANPAATRVLQALQEALDQPRRDRMENLLVVAESGMGKTMLIRKFARENAGEVNGRAGVRRMPVVVALMPPEPTERDFFTRVLAAIGAPLATGRPPGARGAGTQRDATCRLLGEVGARMLVIDEINPVLAGTARQQRLFLQLLRFLSNELRIALVCAGIPEARHALLSDAQLRSRFSEEELPPWTAGPDLQDFVNRIVQGLPLRRPSPVQSAKLCGMLAERTGGITLHVRRVLERAAVSAIRSGREFIDRAALGEGVHWRGVAPPARGVGLSLSRSRPSG